jgi:YVTN family beta-propeller protein
MKTTKFFRALIIAALCMPFFTSCEPEDISTEIPEISTGLFVLNQGKFEANNAGLTYFDFTSGFTSPDVFLAKNDRGLGDTGQDMIKYGSYIYIAMYKSSLVEVVNAKTGVSVKTIPMKNEENVSSSPRSLAAANGKVYVVLFDGHVAQLDTISFEVEKTIAVGTNPEGCVISNNKLYVANSGGLQIVNDSTVSVIDLGTFTEIKKITVNVNPGAVKADAYGDIYVVSSGDYYMIPGKFQRIEAGTDKVTDIDVAVKNIDIVGDKAYISNFEYDANWQVSNKTIAIYDVKKEELVSENIISTDIIKVPYCINVDPVTKNIYLGVSDYKNDGKMYCFGEDGTYKYSFTTGVNPTKVIFITK